MLFSTLKRSNSRISLNEAIQCSLPTSATSRDGSLLEHLFFPLWTTFSTQTSLIFSRRRPQTRPGCLRFPLYLYVLRESLFQVRVNVYIFFPLCYGRSAVLIWSDRDTVWHEIYVGVYFGRLAIFCVLRELIFATKTDWFFLLEINFCDFQKVPSAQH